MVFVRRKPQIEMNALNLQLAFYQSEHARYELLVANVHIKGWLECDLIGIRKNAQVDEVEIKLSRSDFKADFSKTVAMEKGQLGAVEVQEGHLTFWQGKKHDLLAAGLSPVNRFWFMAPLDLLSVDELPEHAGLIEVTKTGSLRITKLAPLLHKRKADDSFRYNCLRQQGWRVWDYMTGTRKIGNGMQLVENPPVD
ncbi:hypothetical protein ACEUAI_20860 [Aeromonas veronii]|nr:hypothetical protein [Aeromonas veronii]